MKNNGVRSCVWCVTGPNWHLYVDGHENDSPVEIASILLNQITNYKNIPALYEYFEISGEEPFIDDEVQVANDLPDNKPTFISVEQALKFKKI